MKIKVVLSKDLKGQGKIGDVIEVNEGYARNFLIPKNLAKFADASALQEMGRKAQVKNEKEAKLKTAREKLSGKLAKEKLIFSRPTADKGTLYAAIHDVEIIEELKQKHPELSEISLPNFEPIKNLGTHKVIVSLGFGITVEMIIEIKSAS